jgi:hypothetical protein
MTFAERVARCCVGHSTSPHQNLRNGASFWARNLNAFLFKRAVSCHTAQTARSWLTRFCVVRPGDIPVEQPSRFELVMKISRPQGHGLTVS